MGSRDDSSPLVQNISIKLTGTNDLFKEVSDASVQIEEDGQVVMHNGSNNQVGIRGKNEYTSGRHIIRLSIEQSASTWTFVGINSKLTPLQNLSHASKSTYGWTNNNYFWLNGGGHPNTSTPAIEMKKNDVLSLIFDCDHRKILMINERTNAKYELVVNIDHCPFPWQLHVNLYEPNSRVRILSA